MLQKVVISMQTIQNCDDSNAETLDFITDGLYSFDDNIGCAMYEESEVTGMPGTQTSVLIMPDQVVVDRNGSVTSRMVFREGEKTNFLYSTPFGDATLGVKTGRISHKFDSQGGRADIEYVIDVEHTVFSKNRLSIHVKQAGGRADA